MSARTPSCRTCPALHLLLTEPARAQRRRRTRRGIDIRHQSTAEDPITYLREQQLTLTYDPAAGTGDAAQAITLKAS